jgi:hypothetical protein
MAGAIGTHGFTEGREKGLLTEAREKLEAFELVLDRDPSSRRSTTRSSGVSVSSSSQIASAAVTSMLVTGSCRDDEPADRRR